MKWHLVWDEDSNQRWLLNGDVGSMNLWVTRERKFVRVRLTKRNTDIEARLPLRRSRRRQAREVLEWADAQVLSPVEALARSCRR